MERDNYKISGYCPDCGNQHCICESMENEKILCNFIKCAAGMGVAGNLNCFLKGDYRNPKCKKFIDEDEFIKQMKLKQIEEELKNDTN